MCHCRILSCLCSHSWLVTQPSFYSPLWQSTHISAFTPNGNVLIKESWCTPCLVMPGRTQAVLILSPQQKILRFFGLLNFLRLLDCPVHICNSSQPGLSAHGSLKSQGWQFLLAEILPFSSNTNTALCTAYLPGSLEGRKATSYLTVCFSVGGQCALMGNSLCSPQEWGSWKSPKMRLWPEEVAL